MKKGIIYLILVCILFSCDSLNKHKKPDNLIAKDKMIHVIIDMSLLSSAKGSNKIVLEELGISPENYVFREHKIDSVQFASSNAYYARDIETYQNIYEKVKDSLEALKKEYKLIQDLELEKKRVKDSIRKRERKPINDSLGSSKIDSKKIQRKSLPNLNFSKDSIK